jgi:hypothetical protein
MADAFIFVFVLAGLCVALGIGIRSLQSDWKDPIIRGLSFRKRRRLGKLARGQEPITDPELSRNAEAQPRWMVWLKKGSHSPRHTIWSVLPVVVVFLQAALNDSDKTTMALGGAALGFVLVISLVAFRWNRRVLNEIERTAQINGWSLDSNSS